MFFYFFLHEQNWFFAKGGIALGACPNAPEYATVFFIQVCREYTATWMRGPRGWSLGSRQRYFKMN